MTRRIVCSLGSSLRPSLRSSSSCSSRGQLFTLDLVFGLVITVLAFLLFLSYRPSPEPPFVQDTERVAVLMTPGIPADWNATNVIIPGFLTEDRFNATKIAIFENLTPAAQKRLLGVQSGFSISFFQTALNASNVSVTTKLALCTNCTEGVPSSPDNVRVIRRYGILNSTITTMEVTLAQ